MEAALAKKCITERVAKSVGQGSFSIVNESAEEEKGIITRVLAGERDEFRILVRTNQDRVHSIILRQVGNYHVAEELAQETFIRAYKSLKTFQFNSSFSTWITRIAINQCSNYFSSRRYKEYRKSEAFEAVHEKCAADGMDRDLERTQRLLLFQRALAALNPKLREVIVLCTLNEKSYEEVSRLLKIPIGTVRSRLNTARLQLKTEMNELQEKRVKQDEG